MSNSNQNSFEVWICPNCKAKNKGQRCIVCGTNWPLSQYKGSQHVLDHNSQNFQGTYSPKRTPEPPKKEKAFKWLPILIIVEIIIIVAIIGIAYIGKTFITGYSNESQEIFEGSITEYTIEFTETSDFIIPIIYDSNGGENAPLSQNGLVYNHEMTITHPNNIPVRNGYVFSGWLYENDANYAIDQPGATVSWGELYYNDPITYYAQWITAEGEHLESNDSESLQNSSKWPAAAEFEVWVNAGVGEINIRSGPGMSYPSIGRIQEGSSAVVHEIDSSSGADWGKIGEGWICLDYVTLEKQSPTDYLSLFVGQWGDRIGQRCMMSAEQRGDKLYVELKWSSDASTTTCWELLCSPVAGDYYVGYQDGVCYTLVDSNGTTNRISHYTNGYGGFQLEGELIYWIDALENRGDQCVFEKIK